MKKNEIEFTEEEVNNFYEHLQVASDHKDLIDLGICTKEEAYCIWYKKTGMVWELNKKLH